MKRDPGLPNLYPYKETVMRREQELHEKAHVSPFQLFPSMILQVTYPGLLLLLQREKERQRVARQKLMDKQRNKSSSGLQAMQEEAARRAEEYESNEKDEAALAAEGTGNGEQVEQSRRAYYKEFRKVVDAADVILEVLDARDPIGCRCSRIEREIMAAGSGKRLVLVLNKVDLVPREVVEGWLKYLRNDYPTIAFKASTQQQSGNLQQSKGEAFGGKQSAPSACFGAQTLLSLLGNFCRNLDIRTAIRVGVVGYPNVGKSSLINSLKRGRVCGVGSTPGFTKVCQEIVLDKHVKLIDSPGIVFSDQKKGSRSDLILRNCVNLDSLADPLPAVEAILARCNAEEIMERYIVPAFTSPTEFLVHFARRLGKLKKGGYPDAAAAAKVILNDWNSGKISYYTVPPETHKMATHVSASLVSEWGTEFDIDSVIKAEEETLIESLVTQDDHRAFAVKKSNVGEMMNEDELDEENEDECVEANEEDAMQSHDDDDDSVDINAPQKLFVTSIRPKKVKGATKGDKIIDGGAALQTNLGNRKAVKAFKKQQRREESKGDSYDFGVLGADSDSGEESL